ncbi:hypothetical protein TIFTF001_014194 [Ficus carica]|uniref:Uncharacterized protein n=1 Tax=Ficus carica TaxID=3494 RepID=A0AA88A5M0_FICCA|nr:hypothetical protein TIFTF001_014194 [Ficus carica]
MNRCTVNQNGIIVQQVELISVLGWYQHCAQKPPDPSHPHRCASPSVANPLRHPKLFYRESPARPLEPICCEPHRDPLSRNYRTVAPPELSPTHRPASSPELSPTRHIGTVPSRSACRGLLACSVIPCWSETVLPLAHMQLRSLFLCVCRASDFWVLESNIFDSLWVAGCRGNLPD